MKTNFLAKLFLMSIVCISLYSCTADEPAVSPSNSAAEFSARLDGEPYLTPPKK
jgi:hypothetical protein